MVAMKIGCSRAGIVTLALQHPIHRESCHKQVGCLLGDLLEQYWLVHMLINPNGDLARQNIGKRTPG